jgi:glyoxylase-like metal-dependent hydrolase (beta-lactamase superfamily II)
MRPPAAPDGLVCHVLLIETDNVLALVDSGYGLRDIADPGTRVGPARFFVRPTFDSDETAVHHVRRLGFDPHDVRHIILTHFDADHVGGLADFPWAKVHLTAAEAFAALHPQIRVEHQRYRPAQRDHHPKLVEHSPADSEVWRGFPGAKELTDIAPGIVLINLPGHTRGHAAIAVDAGRHWILHAGDSFYHHAQVDDTGHAPRTLTGMERVVAYDWRKVKANHQRLQQLWNHAESDLLVVNAHDPTLLHRAQQSTV